MAKNKSIMTKELKKDFTKVPNRIFKMGLSPIAITIYIVYCMYSDDFHPSTPYLCKLLNLSKPTILRYKKELRDRNLIQLFYKGGLGKTSKYKLIKPDLWINTPPPPVESKKESEVDKDGNWT